MDFRKIIDSNILEIKRFISDNIETHQPSNQNNIDVDCPYCDENRHRKKMTINLTWGCLCYCHKCNKTISIFQLFKDHGIYDKFIDFLSTLTNNSIGNIKDLIANFNYKTQPKVIEKLDIDIVDKYVKSNIWMPVKEIKEAYNYGMERCFNIPYFIKDCYCDDKYLYFPTKYKNVINGFVGRLYIPELPFSRYNNIKLMDTELFTYGYDEVVNNFDIDTIYLTEGIFDKIAIDYATNTECAIALCGKSHFKAVVSSLGKDLPRPTNICICLDSIDKDKDIVKSNIQIAKECAKYFSNIFVVSLKNGDPNEIVNKYGSMELENQLKSNRDSMFMYVVKNRS